MWELDYQEGWVPNDAFELLCWTRLLWIPWLARRSNQSILKEIYPEYSLEGLTLKLKLQYFGHLIRADSLKKDPEARKDWRPEEKGRTEDEMVRWHHCINGYEFEQALGDDEGQGSLVRCSPWSRKELVTTEQVNNNNRWFEVRVSIEKYWQEKEPWIISTVLLVNFSFKYPNWLLWSILSDCWC